MHLALALLNRWKRLNYYNQTTEQFDTADESLFQTVTSDITSCQLLKTKDTNLKAPLYC